MKVQKSRLMILISVLTIGVFLAASCTHGEPPASEDPSVTSERDSATPTESETEPSSESGTAPSSESTKEPSSESETGTPSETEMPSESETEPTTYVPRDPSDVEIVTLNDAGLSEEKLELLQRCLTDLAVVQDASGLDYVSEEVKRSWNYLPYGGLKFTVNIVWDEENELVVSCFRNSGKAVDAGLRYDLIVFRKEETHWTVAQDIWSDLWMMEDVSDQTAEIVKEVFHKARAARPITEEGIEEAREAVLKYVVDWQWGWPEEQKSVYRSQQEILYYPEWSDENLPLVLSWSYDYRVPALLFIDRDNYGMGQTIIVYVSFEDGAWKVRQLGTRFRPELPDSYPKSN